MTYSTALRHRLIRLVKEARGGRKRPATTQPEGRGLPPYRATGDETKRLWGARAFPGSTFTRKDPPMITYDQIKQLAVEEGVSVTNLISLARQNAPFYCGSTGQVEKGRWFADLWQQFGYSDGVHLRRIHYRLVSQDPPVVKPDGRPYENTTNDWAYLLQASKAARYLNLVDPAAFVDRRNPDPHLVSSITKAPRCGDEGNCPAR